ncbi:putative signal transducing protein [Vibrio sp. RC27]
MKSIFEASNTLEAHMMSNLLEQEGIKSNVEGEFLQGGIGELQAQGLVRVTVDDADYDAARSFVKEWESTQPSSDSSNASSEKIPKGSRHGVGFVIGVLVGVVAMYWAYNSPVNRDGIDYDRNGTNDEVWIYKDNRITKAEVDRNLDGNVDLINNYDLKGLLASSKLDDDFDGVFETTVKIRKGNAYI